MHSTTNQDNSINECRLENFPAIASLRITNDDLEGLSQQGFLCAEKRGGRTYYKLRFRRDGKQVVRYVGNADRAAAVESELSKLQHDATIMRDLKAGIMIAKEILREAKIVLKPVLEANGLAFHGLAIRRSRKRCVEV